MSRAQGNRRTDAPPSDAGQFATTRWSLVAAAGGTPSPEARDALAVLCGGYWYPLYAYVRRRGHDAHDAADMTQAFFARLLEKNDLRMAQRQRGRFRSFLLASLNHFMANQWRHDRAARRGGGRAVLSIDYDSGESRYKLEPAHDQTPQRLFERRWALALLEAALAALRREFADKGKLEQFEQLKVYLAGGQASPYQQAAEKLGMTEGAVKVAVHRMRRRCRRLLRDQIVQTLAEPTDQRVDEEMQHLFTAIAQ